MGYSTGARGRYNAFTTTLMDAGSEGEMAFVHESGCHVWF